MKKFLAILLAAVMVLSLAACTSQPAAPTAAPVDNPTEVPADKPTDAPADNPTDAPAPAPEVNDKIALVTDVGTIDDESFNQATWEGVKAYCTANNIPYEYFQPTEDSTEARLAKIDEAVAGGYTVVVMPGYLFRWPDPGQSSYRCGRGQRR